MSLADTSMGCGIVLQKASFEVALSELAFFVVQADREFTRDAAFGSIGQQLVQRKKRELRESLNMEPLVFERLLQQRVEAVQDEFDKKQLDVDSLEKIQNETLTNMLLDQVVEFHTLDAGPVETPSWVEEEVVLEKPLVVMNTPVSRKLWKQVARLIHSHLTSGWFVKDISTSDDLYGDALPVTNITYSQATRWLRSLNVLGNSQTEMIAELFPGHLKGDRYDLLSKNEFKALYYQLLNTHSLWRENPQEQWEALQPYMRDSKGALAEIGRHSPLKDQHGNRYWDIFGNIYQLTLINSNDLDNRIMTVIGGSSDLPELFRIIHLDSHQDEYQDESLGFRIVRRRR